MSATTKISKQDLKLSTQKVKGHFLSKKSCFDTQPFLSYRCKTMSRCTFDIVVQG